MLKIKDDVDLKKLERFGFKYGTREKFEWKTSIHGSKYKIYLDLLPCRDSREICFECPSFSIPDKVIDKIYDLISAGLVEKVTN